MAAPLLGAGVGLVGNLLSGIFGIGAENDANRKQQEAIDRINALPIPDIEKQQLQLQLLQDGEKMDPRLEQVVSQGNSDFDNIQVDPRLKQAQLNALTSLQGISDSGGMTLQNQADLNRLLTESATADRGRRQAIQQNMAQRGIQGSGLELASKLDSAQDTATLQNQAALDSAGMAQRNALDALSRAGNLGGDIRGQDFSQQAAAAQARDAIAQFNARNSQNVQGSNVDRLNNAMAGNIDRSRSVADRNVALANEQQSFNKGLYQQQFKNQLDRANAAAAAQKDASAYQRDTARNNTKNIGGGFSELGKATSLRDMFNSNFAFRPQAKKNKNEDEE